LNMPQISNQGMRVLKYRIALAIHKRNDIQ